MKTLQNTLLLLLSIGFFACKQEASEKSQITEEEVQASLTDDERMAWWRDAKFGMFIHWGLYAIPAGEYNGKKCNREIGEWIMDDLEIPIKEYEQFATQFNPVNYDPDAWVKMAKDAGMKYIVITSKHHDGFALWDSKVSDYDVVDSSPYGKDLLKPLAEACEKAGIRLCFYHSIMDWHHPDAQSVWEPHYQRERSDTLDSQKNPNFPKYLDNFMKPQLNELLTNYGDIGVLWFDGEWVPAYTTEQGKAVHKYIMDLKPDLIVNNRVDKGRAGMEGFDIEGDFAGDFGTPEQEIPERGIEGVDWESCMTMNDTWGFRKDDHHWKSDTTLIRQLVDVTSKGGNFLLNIGPKADGTFPQASVDRLASMAKWMKVNSQGIYDTSPSPVEFPEWGRITQKGDSWYLFVFDSQADNLNLEIGNLKVESAKSLSGVDVAFENKKGVLSLALSEEIKNEFIPVIKLN